MEDQAEYGVDVKNIKRRGGRWDPDKITGETLVPKDLADLIEEEVWLWYQKGMVVEDEKC